MKATHFMLLILAGSLLLAGLAQTLIASEPREVRFYQDEPECKEKKLGYVVLSGPFYTTEHHRVWVCGLEFKR